MKFSHLTEREQDLLDEIADRVKAVLPYTRLSRFMITNDVGNLHLNGCPLDLEAMAKGRATDLVHDVFGIHRHFNRKTGQLENCFLPRFAKKAGRS